MGLDLDAAEGQTPLDDDERDGLRIVSITTRGELDEFEQLGVEQAVACSMKRRFTIDPILTEEFVKEVHRRMFSEIWTWAGEFRSTNKNLGVDAYEIRQELKKLLDDCLYWVNQNTFPPDEIAVRFGHRMVCIHPFANGNGRHSRLITDILVHHGLGRPYFTWGSVRLTSPGSARSAYLQALREADRNNVAPLLLFARENG